MVLKCAISNRCVTLARKLTNNLRVIQHAWHFRFGLSLVINVFKLSVVVECLTP
ncbi:DUF3265 domain-containing protein [Vibrio parahaemolyticus]|nr:DUF3265 domain-containing protein [Vibrio hepatarius]MCR9509014.1 DUF3265 domain-containing protein [Vibrio parahaemolyticus]MCS0119217.1 DUF3265 domain-containing protein [Vibrio parahaemolyticus]